MLETALTNKPYKTNIIEVTTGLQAYNMPAYWLQVDVINILKLSPAHLVSNVRRDIDVASEFGSITRESSEIPRIQPV